MTLRSEATDPQDQRHERDHTDRRSTRGRRAVDARGTRSTDGWLDRWIATMGDMTRLLDSSHPMLDAVIDEQRGRQIRIGSHWLTDWASCNYLGFDLDQEIIDAIPDYLAKWGTHPSWSRLLGSPKPYIEIEEQLTALLGCEDVLVMPTITHVHMSVIPVLAGRGTIFLDGRAHKTIYDGAMVAAGVGATVIRFRANDAEHLEQLIRAAKPGPARIIAMDGVNSMTGNAPDLATFSRIARQYDALLYLDDAHGFGMLGERSPDELCPYGITGNSLFRHLNVAYDNAVLVGALSKSYSSLAAFMALPTRLKEMLKMLAPPYLYSGPSPVASLASVLVGLDVNRKRGDKYRADVWNMTSRILDTLRELDIRTPNESGFPIIEIPLANHEDIDQAGLYLFERGVYVTMAAYPLVPKSEVGVRVQVTAANTNDEVDHLVGVISDFRERFTLQRQSAAATPLAARDGKASVLGAGLVATPLAATADELAEFDLAHATKAQILERATRLCGGGAYEEAVKLLDRALQNFAEDAQLQVAAGWALENLGPARLAEARVAYEAAVALDANSLWARVGLANVLGRLGGASAAETIYQSVLEQTAMRAEQEPHLLEMRGRCQYRLGLLDDAVETFRCALGDDATPVSVYFDLGLALLARGSGEDAILQYEVGLAHLAASESGQRRGPLMVALGDLYEALRWMLSMRMSTAANKILAKLVRATNEQGGVNA